MRRRTVPPCELAWLPERPADWVERLTAVDALADEPAWNALVALANTRLDGLATIRLDRRLQGRFPDAAPPAAIGTPIRLAVLASTTAGHLLPGLRVAALRRGMRLTTYLAEYGQYRQEGLDPGSGLAQFGPTAILFALDARHACAAFALTDTADQVTAMAATWVDDLAGLWRRASATWGCTILQQALLPVFPPLFGGNEHRLSGSGAALVPRLNGLLRTRADTEGADIVVLDSQAAQDGMLHWHDPVLWHRAKQEVHPACAPLYGDLVVRLLAAQQGRSFKCLVLDLDNTLWGGVIGDDGVAGIALGQGSALGESFAEFQNYAKNLSRRGVILAVCSKNDEANAMEAFDTHPDMVLRRADIGCFAVNWTDKAANLRDIASRLNIGLDALVFADDNLFERTIIRRELPMVAVPELPDDPAFYAMTIAGAGYFESIRLTREDVGRTGQYQDNARREILRESATDLDGYLRSLDMRLHWRRFDAVGQSRIVQLINKTNQFNLTTRRTTDDAVAALIANRAALTLQLRLLDSFGDNGVVGIVTGHPNGTAIVIDTWLMSCRVLGRGVERATLHLVVAEARRLGAATLTGVYVPSAKNGMVRDHYKSLGFSPADDGPDFEKRWTLDLAQVLPAATHIQTIGD